MNASTGILDMLRATGALKVGHFLLSSGLHSDQYVEKFDLLRQPAATSEACALIADRFRDQSVGVVVGPTTGGVILAFEVARQLDISAAYAERAAEGSAKREFRRGTTFSPGSRVLVVDDILTTGGSVRETLDALREQSVEIVGVAVLVDRRTESVDVGVPIVALARMSITSWEQADCPLCASGVPLVKRGTTPGAVPARPSQANS